MANLIVCGLFLILSVPFFLGQIRVLRSWPVAEAQIIRNQVVVEPAAKHDQLYSAKLEVVYVVKQQPVTVEAHQLSEQQLRRDGAAVNRVCRRSRDQIRYDPQNPTQARIGAGWNRRFFAVPLITAGCGLCFGAIAVGCFLAARMRRPRVPAN